MLRSWTFLAIFVLWPAAFVPAAEPAFSHKRHATLKYPCVRCHAGATTAESARFPTAAACAVCHVDRTFPVFPTERVYRLPAVVIFSHTRHHQAKVACASCHGEVQRQDRLKVELPATMKACVDCHKKGGATTACAACHELGQ